MWILSCPFNTGLIQRWFLPLFDIWKAFVCSCQKVFMNGWRPPCTAPALVKKLLSSSCNSHVTGIASLLILSCSFLRSCSMTRCRLRRSPTSSISRRLFLTLDSAALGCNDVTVLEALRSVLHTSEQAMQGDVTMQSLLLKIFFDVPSRKSWQTYKNALTGTSGSTKVEQ